MSKPADVQALNEELTAWKRRCVLAECAVKDAYALMHEDVFPLLGKDGGLAVAAIRVSSRLYTNAMRTWHADWRKWF